MADLKLMRIDENDVAALYRRYLGMPAAQRCLLSLNLDDGSFSAGYERPGCPAPEPVRTEDCHAARPLPGPVMCWPIPCLTAEGANQVLETLAPLATRILAWTVRDSPTSGYVFRDGAAVAAGQITRLCKEIGLIVDLTDEVVEEHDAPGWFAEDDLTQEHGITAGTSDKQLRALAYRLERSASPNARPVAIVLGVLHYLTEYRDALRTPVTR